jgi:long-chain acyl-CoA synthetase
MFRGTVAQHGGKEAMRWKADKTWHSLTYAEVDEKVRRLSLGLMELGVTYGDRIALLSENRPEWAFVDLADLSIGAINCPMYSTLPPPQVEYIVNDCGARVVVVSEKKQLAKITEIRANLSKVEQVIVMDPPAELPEGVISLADVMAKGAAVEEGAKKLEERTKGVKPDDLASIIYTSGTTGPPKGAVLTHDNFMSNCQSASKLFGITSEDLFLSFLPLSHVFERVAGHYFPLLAGATIAYAESVFTVQNNIGEVRPTVMASVPRLYEAMHSKILDGIAKQPDNKRKFAEWALKVGWDFYSKRIRGEAPGLLTSLLFTIAESKVLWPIREKVTGGRLRGFISGGAPLPVGTAKFLTSVGIRMFEGYGLTETSPVICLNLPSRTKLGTVGPPIPGVEVKIADDGEICSRGPHIMVGYYNLPKETSEAIDDDGWFHTGDIGELDDEGYLKITDRKKDLLVLANGKKVAPQNIESVLKGSPYISAAVLFGDRQPQVVALIVPDFSHLKQWARENNLEAREPQDLAVLPETRKLLKKEIERLTPHLADFEKVRRFAVLAQEFSLERDELTPTLKIKRRIVAQNYADEIQKLYMGRGVSED